VTASKITNPSLQLPEKFAALFGTAPIVIQAPGRVNLIGDHTDYNDGFVMPAAIPFHTTVAIAARTDERLVIFSENYGEQVEFATAEFPPAARRHWSDYIVGVASKLKEQGIRAGGANLLIRGDVPQGSGLSSSASLEVAVCQALLEVAGQSMTGTEMALLCQRAENEFVGARCGIMDQFVSVHGERDHALLLDCRSLEYSQQPLPPEVRVVICNTMVRHSVAEGEYNQRRRECEAGAHFFAERRLAVKALRDVSMEEFQKYADALPETIRKRCRHVISEDARVIEAAAALRRKDLVEFGRLMGESHSSLRDDFEVSCRELDAMVDLAKEIDGVYGARMTGGGFGGCTVNLVKGGSMENFQTKIASEYERATGQRPEIYACTAADGVRRVQ
jgi:galactokinase